jgi:hypothetical protein
MGCQNDIFSEKVATVMDDRALNALRTSLSETSEAAVESLREAADYVTYNDTIETILMRADQLASELDGDLRRRVEEIAERLRRRRDQRLGD